MLQNMDQIAPDYIKEPSRALKQALEPGHKGLCTSHTSVHTPSAFQSYMFEFKFVDHRGSTL